MPKKTQRSELTGEAFDALRPTEKERIFQELEAEPPERRLARSRPLNAAQRARWERIRKSMRRPKGTKRLKVISVGVDQNLLTRADAYAKRAGISRAQLVARGLHAILGAAA